MDIQIENLFFLGLDLSTQSLKLCVFDENSIEVYRDKIIFSDILFENEEVVHFTVKDNHKSAEQDVLIFLRALDLGLEKLNKQFAKKISALSVSGQQHGSVYYQKEILYDSKKNLIENLKDSFATILCPIWMDSSTSSQCKEISEQFTEIHKKSGSRAFERFSFSQIIKKYQLQKEIYDKTIHISLISSFLAEIFIGKFISVDYGDASGINLMDLKSKKYIQEMVDYVPDLQKKLGVYQPIKSWQSVGRINDYFIHKYNNIFSQDSFVIASTGDNLASMVGMGLLNPSYLAISLGTSDTLFGIINENDIEKSLDPNIHIFCSPLRSDQYLLLLCQKNGGMMREEIISKSQLTWEEVEEYYFNIYKPKGFYGCFLQQPEIVPPINCPNQIEEIKNVNNDAPIKILPVEKIILLLEYKIISLRINFLKDNISKLILTGGACKNRVLQQISSNVFGCPVFIQGSEDSACIGSALRAHHGYLNHIKNDEIDFYSHFNSCNAYNIQQVSSPDLQLNQYYTEISPFIQQLEQNLCKQYPY
ncbi:xylulose kinase (macronuclear) [Tetrahymena thermophila SB210]|uniref:Xylulose kinase n=1 Tax=Tetrahymena thermophila (strain SB210) TaxID=312017 RepID=I7LVM1_TETTS|nr:xylulose kinase [Tetrahymena thermophila SB210]EAR98489.1 xylulose kinase [Tetrahymena thermophila SB210]|eukprot:XP_001018734.1 xylulose kinase [Tetrahymena thermophila SB210]